MDLSRLMPRVAAVLLLLLLGGLSFSTVPGRALGAMQTPKRLVADETSGRWNPGGRSPVLGKQHPVERSATASSAAILTFKYNNKRSGHNPAEMQLTTDNVNASQFGKRATLAVDGQVYAQPLYVPALEIHGRKHNVVFVATEHDSVYAFDADAVGAQAALLWHTSFLRRGVRVPNSSDVACNDLVPEIGITGTPVIDVATRTMFVVSFTNEGGRLLYRLHALDISSGLERRGSPVVIQATVPGRGAGSRNGQIRFDPKHQRQRAALLLANGRIYIAWGSFCDNMPYHGWIMSYTYDGSMFHQVAVFNDTPDGARAGIWGAGGALTADDQGYIYYSSGNGSFNLHTGGHDTGDSIVKLTPSLRLVDYFTPFNQRCLEEADADLGSTAPLLLPSSEELITSGKEGRIYVIARNHMGRYHSIPDACQHEGRTDVDQIVQEFPPTTIGGLFSTPAYWQGSDSEYVYFASVNRPVVAYRLTQGRLSAQPVSASPEALAFPGANVVISSSGNRAGTGILWLIDPRGVLRAYDAANLGRELYSSDQYADRDGLPGYIKFTVPAVADGKVFVPTARALLVFGLLPKARGEESRQPVQSVRMTKPGSGQDGAPAQQPGPGQPAATDGKRPGPGQLFGPGGDLPGPHQRPGPGWTAGPVASVAPGDGDAEPVGAPAGFGPAVTPSPVEPPTPTPGSASSGAGGPGQPPASGPTRPGPAAMPAYNNIGISDDARPATANFDQNGNSYSAQALQRAGINPGDHVFAGGFVFVWPNVLSGEPDNYVAAGQTLTLGHHPHAKMLGLLGAADHGAAHGQLLISFTDGSTATVPIGFSDWTLDQGSSKVLPQSPEAISLPYYNSVAGHVQSACYVFYVSIPLPAGKTVKSITLPTTVTGGRMHVFAVALK
jgi:hypothetical protein